MKTVKFSLIIFTLLHVFNLAAQENNSLKLYPGPGLILFSVGNEAVHPAGQITEYIIEKQRSSDAEYKKIASVKQVGTFKKFNENIKKFLLKFPHVSSSAMLDFERLFAYINKGNSLQDLGSSGKNILVQAGFGLMWWDEQVVEGQRYRYRILNQKSQIISESDWLVYSSSNDVPPLEFLYNNYHQLMNRNSIYLKNVHPYHIQKVEVRRKYYGEEEEEIGTINQIQHNVDTTRISIIDTTIIPYRIIDYTIRVTDLPGNVSDWSPPLTLVSFDYLQMPLPTNISTVKDSLNSGVKIRWELENSALLSKLDLYRSNNSVDGFQLIASLYPGLNEYSDSYLNPFQAYFYYFEGTYKMFGTPKRGITFSAYYAEDYPPLPPELESVFTDEKGITIRWTTNERNILGFRVYRAMVGEEYQLVSDMIPFDIQIPVYEHVDTDPTLAGNKFYNYAVKAIGKNLVESIYSDPLKVRPIINVPIPQRPIEPEASVDEGRILVFWNVGVDRSPDFLGYRIIRKNSYEPLFIDTFYTAVNMLIDTTAIPEVEYSYTISESSIFGTRSTESNPVKQKIKLQAPPPPLSLSLGNVGSGFRLTWELPSDGEFYRYNIYRYQRGSTPEKIGTTFLGAESFTDQNPIQNRNLVFYFIRSLNENGLESENSNEVSIRWQ